MFAKGVLSYFFPRFLFSDSKTKKRKKGKANVFFRASGFVLRLSVLISARVIETISLVAPGSGRLLGLVGSWVSWSYVFCFTSLK